VEEGQEEGISGRELERWWDGPGGWKADPVEALGGEVCTPSHEAPGSTPGYSRHQLMSIGRER